MVTVLEFRNKSLFDESHQASTLEFEREMGVANVIVDSPKGLATACRQCGISRAQSWPWCACITATRRRGTSRVQLLLRIALTMTTLSPSLRNCARNPLAGAQGGTGTGHLQQQLEDQGQRNAASLMNLLH